MRFTRNVAEVEALGDSLSCDQSSFLKTIVALSGHYDVVKHTDAENVRCLNAFLV